VTERKTGAWVPCQVGATALKLSVNSTVVSTQDHTPGQHEEHLKMLGWQSRFLIAAELAIVEPPGTWKIPTYKPGKLGPVQPSPVRSIKPSSAAEGGKQQASRIKSLHKKILT
jgi:hypothetical protein